MATNTAARIGGNGRSAQHLPVAALKPHKAVVIKSTAAAEGRAVERRLVGKVADINRGAALVDITDLDDEATYKALFGGS